MSNTIGNTILRTTGLKKYFSTERGLKKNKNFVRAVDDVNIEIKEGETLGLVGESGSGKTTLAKLILGLLEPTAGGIEIEGSVGAVFQDPASSLNPRATVYRSLERPLEIHGYNKSDAKDIINETCEKVNLRKELLDRFPHELSGGQQQRVSIARALVKRPQMILADEPTAALDYETSIEVLQALEERVAEGMTLVMVTHNEEIAKMANRVIRMKSGVISSIKINHHPAKAAELSW